MKRLHQHLARAFARINNKPFMHVRNAYNLICVGQMLSTFLFCFRLSRMYLSPTDNDGSRRMYYVTFLCLLFFLNLFCIIGYTIDVNDERGISSGLISNLGLDLRRWISYIREEAINTIAIFQTNLVYCNKCA